MDGGEDGPHKVELELILGVRTFPHPLLLWHSRERCGVQLVEALQKRIDAEGVELRRLKDELRDNESKQVRDELGCVGLCGAP